MKKKCLGLLISIVIVFSVVCLVACNADDPDYGAYVLSDKGTYLSFKKNVEGDKIPNLTLLYEQDESLKNTYSMIAVDGSGAGFTAPVVLNERGADSFIKWMSLPSTQNLIKEFGKANYDEALFYMIPEAQVFTGLLESLAYNSSVSSTKVIRVSTTTSVNDTGLLGSLETVFESATGWDIQVSSAGTGAAIQSAKDGNADILLVHAASSERTFIDGNFARTVSGLTGEALDADYPERISFMFNYFVLLGSSADPAGVKNCTNISAAFDAIAKGGYNFISRGDKSGTHTAELNLWKNVDGITLVNIDLSYVSKGETLTATSTAPQGLTEGQSASWYVSAGQGMGACLTMASEYRAIG